MTVWLLRDDSAMNLTVAMGFIPVGLRSGPQARKYDVACEDLATASQPNGDKSPRHNSYQSSRAFTALGERRKLRKLRFTLFK